MTPYLVVNDLTSGRPSLFNAANGYVSEVIAPVVGTTTPYFRTTLT